MKKIATKTVGNMTLKEAMPFLKHIADQYQLKLNRARDFRIVKNIFVNMIFKN